jgi:hypothetical protein
MDCDLKSFKSTFRLYSTQDEMILSHYDATMIEFEFRVQHTPLLYITLLVQRISEFVSVDDIIVFLASYLGF